MDNDGYYNFWQNPKTLLALYSISFPLFLIFITPLLQFSKSRIPMLLLFSKSIGMAFVLFITPISSFLSMFSINPNWWIYVLYVNNVPYFAVRIHILAMAFNRFYSVYFPFEYQKTDKKGMLKICLALWVTALILTPPSSYVGMNRNTTFPWILLKRLNVEQICIYSALGFYALMAAKLIWMKYHTHRVLQGSVLEKDYYKISAVCIVSILPFLFGILSLKLMQTFISMGIYQTNHLLADILVSFNVPFLIVANFSEEICLLILSAEFRGIVKTNLVKNAARFLKAITFGRFQMKTTTKTTKMNANGAKNNNISDIQFTDFVAMNNSKCCFWEFGRRNNQIGVPAIS